MKSILLLFLLFICTTQLLTAQCDSTSDVNQVFVALKIDDDLPFLQTSTLYLMAELDKESLAIIKDGISGQQYVRQLNESGHILFDTLRLSDNERKEMDSLVSRQLKKWTNSNILRCRIGRDV